MSVLFTTCRALRRALSASAARGTSSAAASATMASCRFDVLLTQRSASVAMPSMVVPGLSMSRPSRNLTKYGSMCFPLFDSSLRSTPLSASVRCRRSWYGFRLLRAPCLAAFSDAMYWRMKSLVSICLRSTEPCSIYSSSKMLRPKSFRLRSTWRDLSLSSLLPMKSVIHPSVSGLRSSPSRMWSTASPTARAVFSSMFMSEPMLNSRATLRVMVWKKESMVDMRKRL